MQFEGKQAEAEFLGHFHAQRVGCDRIFAIIQLAVVSLLTFHAHKRPAAPLPPVARALFWLTCTSSAAVLALSLAHRQRYTAARPYMIGTARVLFSLLCPQLIWQLAGQMQAQQAAAGAPSWPQIFFLWATWSRCGSVLISQAGFLLPFNFEAVLAPFAAFVNMLNNRRLCRLLTAGGAPAHRQFYRGAFVWLASRLAMPLEGFLAAAPGSSGSGKGSSILSFCTALVASGQEASTGSAAASTPGAAAAAAADDEDVSACHCESVFSFTQLLLTVLLPLILATCAEARLRHQFAAAQLAAAAAAGEAAAGARQARGAAPQQGRGHRRADWNLTYDGVRLLALAILIELRVFLGLRFGAWKDSPWALGGGGSGAAPGAHAQDEL